MINTSKIRKDFPILDKKILNPAQQQSQKIIDLLGLMGDSSDNVPGVSGIGEKNSNPLPPLKYGI